MTMHQRQSYLILVRGPSGSGKTTFARMMFPYEIVEADQFFNTKEGYKFDRDNLSNAHAWCQEQTEYCLQENKDVSVCNTFTEYWEMEPYKKLAIKYNAYLVEVIMPMQPAEELAKKNVHGLRADQIALQIRRWQK